MRYAVMVFDDTCNIGKDYGTYNDYSWVNETLNTDVVDENDERTFATREEAQVLMSEFKKYAEENELDWVSFGIAEVEDEEW